MAPLKLATAAALLLQTMLCTATMGPSDCRTYSVYINRTNTYGDKKTRWQYEIHADGTNYLFLSRDTDARQVFQSGLLAYFHANFLRIETQAESSRDQGPFYQQAAEILVWACFQDATGSGTLLSATPTNRTLVYFTQLHHRTLIYGPDGRISRLVLASEHDQRAEFTPTHWDPDRPVPTRMRIHRDSFRPSRRPFISELELHPIPPKAITLEHAIPTNAGYFTVEDGRVTPPFSYPALSHLPEFSLVQQLSTNQLLLQNYINTFPDF